MASRARVSYETPRSSRSSSSSAFRASEDAPGDDTADAAEEMALPRDSGGREKAAEQRPAPEQGDNRGQGEVAHASAEEAAAQQIAGISEHDAARADVERAWRGEQPGAESRDERDNHRNKDHSHRTRERDQEAEREERDRVGGDVAETGVEERCSGDPDEALWIPRLDAVTVEPQTAHEVDHLADPHDGRHTGHEHEARAARSPAWRPASARSRLSGRAGQVRARGHSLKLAPGSR